MENAGRQKNMNNMKKVSIVTPVYNSEKYLGYCINSILSQTYTNIELILVDDGSTDGSVRICDNYSGIDDRVQVFHVKNGGVGHARNIGIEKATGDYLQFVDSDDVIAPVMTETLVNAMEAYRKDIVLCAMELIGLENDRPSQVVFCTSEGIGKECVLERQVFLENIAQLFWKTAMLEGPCNRLYRNDLFKKYGLRFPTGISLGEDMLMNLEYYEVCNGAVFLSDKLYYYLQTNDQALTKQYRQNLFEEQMMLVDRLQDFIEKNTAFDMKEKIALSEYRVSKAIQCLNAMFQGNATLSEWEIKGRISTIVNDARVRDAFHLARYIIPGYEWVGDQLEFSDVGKIYDRLKTMNSEKSDSEAHEIVESALENPGNGDNRYYCQESMYYKSYDCENSKCDFGNLSISLVGKDSE